MQCQWFYFQNDASVQKLKYEKKRVNWCEQNVTGAPFDNAELTLSLCTGQ